LPGELEKKPPGFLFAISPVKIEKQLNLLVADKPYDLKNICRVFENICHA
jgi:hypothetical protein